jgi:hypothetical protein
MKANQNCKLVQHHHQSVISLALVQYNFSTPEIRMLMRYMLGHAVSGRTIKRLARSTGHSLKRGRPPSTPRVSRGDLSNLLELTSNSVGSFAGNTLHLLHEIYLQFGLTPRQYLRWIAKDVRRGKCMMRRCLLCACIFASTDSGERHCKTCRGDRRRLVNEDRRSSFV